MDDSRGFRVVNSYMLFASDRAREVTEKTAPTQSNASAGLGAAAAKLQLPRYLVIIFLLMNLFKQKKKMF